MKREAEETNYRKRLKAIPLTESAYEAYGKVIRADESRDFKLANMGTAKRFNHLCKLENLRPQEAELNLCVFRCSPLASLPLELKLLEKHEFSSQVFIPMAERAIFLAVVSLGEKEPDLETLKAFLVKDSRGLSYYPGVWHYPMTALFNPVDFACLVFENGKSEDCTIQELKEPVLIDI